MVSAIAKGYFDSPVTVFRAVNRADILDSWRNAYSRNMSKFGIIKSDHAYVFTTMEKEIALWWRRSELGHSDFIASLPHFKGKKILPDEFLILQIEIPAGTSAAFLRGLNTKGGHGDIVILGRNTNLKVNGAELLEDQIKVLMVSVH